MATVDPVTRREDVAPSCTTSSLLTGCDWAYAHGDAETMAHVIARIAPRADDPLRTELLELSRLWRLAPDLAARRWPMLRHSICDCLLAPNQSGCECPSITSIAPEDLHA
jgi:hypothetical protein